MKTFCVVFGVLAVAAAAGWSAPAAEDSGAASAAARANEARLRASCQNNLKQMGLVFKMFANESKGECFPRLSPQPGRLMFDNDGVGQSTVYPEYLTDLNVLVCPADSDTGLLKDPQEKPDLEARIDDHSYYYLGYVVMNEEDLKAFAEAYKERIAKGLGFDEDLTASGRTVRRLREGVERFLITDIHNPAASAQAQSGIPLLIERTDNHEPVGGNVLFMDGHVEYIRYHDEGGAWPMTKAVMDTLKSLEALESQEGDGTSAIPQAQGVAILLSAVKAQDLDMLKSVFSSRMRERLDSEDAWRQGLAAYTKIFEDEFGDYRLEDFSYSFSGDAEAGKVSIMHKNREFPDLSVVKEGDSWKMDEK